MKYILIKDRYLPRSSNGGMFVSPGYGRHPGRKISSFEIIFIRKGQMIMQEDDNVFTLNENDALVLIANKHHKGISEYDKFTSFYWIHFFLESGKYHIADSPSDKDGYYLIHQLSHFHYPNRMIELFCQFLHRQEQGFSCQTESDLLIAQMLIELAFHSNDKPITKSIEQLANNAKKIIDSEFHRPYLSTRSIAEKLDLNSDYLGRIFKQVYRRSISNYLINRRMREAKKLLRESNLNINQVALSAGFNDPGYFRRIFRKHFDMKPSEFRRMYFRIHINVG